MSSFQRGLFAPLDRDPGPIGESIGMVPQGRDSASRRDGPTGGPSNDGSPPMSVFRRTSWRAAMAGASRWLSGASYLRKWLVLGVLIGTMAGVGAIVFYEALWPAPTSSSGRWPAITCPHRRVRAASGIGIVHPSLGTAAGRRTRGLTRAMLVYRFAPEAEGHGTDAAISAVHHNRGGSGSGR